MTVAFDMKQNTTCWNISLLLAIACTCSKVLGKPTTLVSVRFLHNVTLDTVTYVDATIDRSDTVMDTESYSGRLDPNFFF